MFKIGQKVEFNLDDSFGGKELLRIMKVVQISML
jgi:hypothetical protein